MNDDSCMDDYDLDMSDDVGMPPMTSPAAARLYGGDEYAATQMTIRSVCGRVPDIVQSACALCLM